MTFVLYMIGFMIFLGGIVGGAVVAGVPHALHRYRCLDLFGHRHFQCGQPHARLRPFLIIA